MERTLTVCLVALASAYAQKPPVSEEYLLMGDATRGGDARRRQFLESRRAFDPRQVHTLPRSFVTVTALGVFLAGCESRETMHMVWADSRAGFQGVWYGRVPLNAY
jgi:hypothetical protein